MLLMQYGGAAVGAGASQLLRLDLILTWSTVCAMFVQSLLDCMGFFQFPPSQRHADKSIGLVKITPYLNLCLRRSNGS